VPVQHILAPGISCGLCCSHDFFLPELPGDYAGGSGDTIRNSQPRCRCGSGVGQRHQSNTGTSRQFPSLTADSCAMMPGTVKSMERVAPMGTSVCGTYRQVRGMLARGVGHCGEECHSPRRPLWGSVAAALRQFNSVAPELRGVGHGLVGAPPPELRKASPDYEGTRWPGLGRIA